MEPTKVITPKVKDYNKDADVVTVLDVEAHEQYSLITTVPMGGATTLGISATQNQTSTTSPQQPENTLMTSITTSPLDGLGRYA